MERAKKSIIWGAYALLFLLALYLIVVFSIWFGYEGRVRPGTVVAGTSLTGMSYDEAQKAIDNKADGFLIEYPVLTIGEEQVKASDLGLDFDSEATLERIKSNAPGPFSLGRQKEYKIVFTYDADALNKVLFEIDKKTRRVVSNPQLGGDNLEASGGQNGARLVFGEFVFDFKERVGSLNSEIEVRPFIIQMAYSNEELNEILPKVKERISDGLTLIVADKIIKVEKKTLISWVYLDRGAPTLAQNYFQIVNPGKRGDPGYFSPIEIENYLKSISSQIDSDPINATLTVNEGKVAILAQAIPGQALDALESAKDIIEALETSEKAVTLTVVISDPEINESTFDDLGLTELVASGYSNFSGSPQNRRHNIRVGAEKFNGMLLSPDEIFSFTANMGEIDAANGYLPELIIIGNETRPEYGGGLCQVSTTVFRAALNAGFPIVARKAHSYPVRYYQPYGTDATIYSPNPDIKFKNDSGYHLLIQTRIVGNLLYYDFYGTKKEISTKFAGNKAARGAVDLVENVVPYTYGHGGRGSGSFKAVVYRFTYDAAGKLLKTDEFFSNYDSPDKYPR